MTARPEVSEDSKKSPRARKSLRVLAKLRRLAGFRPGRRKITGVPEIGPKTEFLSLQNNTVSERKFDQRSRSSKNHFANFIFLIRMTTSNLNGRGFEPGPVLASIHSGQGLARTGCHSLENHGNSIKINRFGDGRRIFDDFGRQFMNSRPARSL